MRVRVLVVLVANSGCALMANASAHHNSSGRACLDTPAFALVDLALGGIGMAAVVATEQSAGYYAVPGVFLASGALGGFSAVRCQHRRERYGTTVAPPASNTAPSFGDAEVDPEARELTPEERGLVPVEPAPAPALVPAPRHPLLHLRLPADYEVPPPAPEPVEEPISCRDGPGACPPGQTCAIAGAAAGTCVPAP